MLRTITKYLLIINVVLLALVALWLQVGGSNRSSFGGGAASEVDGILLLFLALSQPGPGCPEAAGRMRWYPSRNLVEQE